MKELYCNMLDSAAEITGMGAWSEYCQGFVLGMIFVLLLLILIRIIGRMIFGRRKLKGVTVAGSAGNLHVSIHAIRQFIHRILNEFDEVSLSSVEVRQKRGEILFTIDLEVVPNVELVPLRDRIQQRVVEDAERRLGLGLPVKVDLEIRSIQANAKKSSRSERKQTAKVGKREAKKEPLNERPASSVSPAEPEPRPEEPEDIEKTAGEEIPLEKEDSPWNYQSDVETEEGKRNTFPESPVSEEESKDDEDREKTDDENKSTNF